MIVYVAGKGGFTHEICKVGEEYHFPKNAMTKLYMYDFKLKDGGGGGGGIKGIECPSPQNDILQACFQAYYQAVYISHFQHCLELLQFVHLLPHSLRLVQQRPSDVQNLLHHKNTHCIILYLCAYDKDLIL